MTDKPIKTSRDGSVAVITLDAAPVNAMDSAQLHCLADAVDAAIADSDIRAIVIAGREGMFSAGLNLKVVPGLDSAAQDDLLWALNRSFGSVFVAPKPVVGAIAGHAIAGGMVLVLACDYRVGPEGDFLFGLTEVRVGVPYPVGAIEPVMAALPADTARRMVLFGENIGPEAALAGGVFDELAPTDQVFDRALEQAHKLAELPPRAFAIVKRQQRGSALDRVEAVLESRVDPLTGGWLDDETKTAVRALLAGA